MGYLDLNITPVENYNAPEIPTFEDNNTAIVKKLPSRWQKSAKIIAGLGLVGVFALSGCASLGGRVRTLRPNNVTHNLEYSTGSYRGYSDGELLVRIHTGGGGSSSYMVHLTEHEAFGIIRARLEAAGLDFNARPPARSGLDFGETDLGRSYGDVDWHLVNHMPRVEFDLFDGRKNVGVSFVNWLGATRTFMPEENELAARLEELFVGHRRGVSFGAFHNPGQHVRTERAFDSSILGAPISPSAEAVEEKRPILVRQLINQADIFIARLQLDGVLAPFPDVSVIINEEPLCVGEIPILVNNQIMVPTYELFNALGMEILLEEESWRIGTTGVKNGDSIEVRISLRGVRTVRASARRDGVPERLHDMPVFLHNDVTYAPLQFVADFIGASIEWDADTRTLTISQ